MKISTSFLQLVQFLILCGITTTILNDFFQLNVVLATDLSPSAILKYSFLSKLSETFVNTLKVLCSSITPFLFIVRQYFIFGARNNP